VILGICSLLSFGHALCRAMVPPLLPLLKTEFGISYAMSGLIPSVFFVSCALSLYPFGLISDRIGKKPVIVYGLLLLSLMSFFTGLTGNYGQLLLIRLLAGVATATYFAASIPFITDLFPKEERGVAIGVHESAKLLSYTLAYLLATQIAVSLGWRWPFFTCAILLIIFTAIFWRVMKERAEGTYEPRPESSKVEITIKKAFTQKSVLVLSVVSPVVALSYSVWDFIPLYLVDEHGFDLVLAGILVAALSVAGIFSKPLAGMLSDRFGRKPIMMLSVVLLSLSIFLLPVMGGHVPSITLVLLCFGFALEAYWPVMFAYLMDSLPPGVRTTAFGIFRSGELLMVGMGTFIFGFITDLTNFYTAFFIVASIIAISSTFIAITKM